MLLITKFFVFISIFISINSIEFPIIRKFKNSKLTFNSNSSLKLVIDDDIANFFVLADQGGIPDPPYRTHMLNYTSQLMSKLADEEQTQFQFALGDNFYFDGITSVNDARFKDTFEDAFLDQNLNNTPWFLALGNHDYRGDKPGNVSAQIEYTYKSNRWILPNHLYTLDVYLKSDLLIKSIVIDTQLICDEGAVQEREAYFKLVDETIRLNSNTTASYFLVLGHYPVWSAGVKGPNQCLVQKLRPILHKYKVDGYFCGDEHVMQHFTYSHLNQTVEYLVSGATNFVDDNPSNLDKIDKSGLKFFWKTYEEQYINCEKCSGALVLAKADKNKMDLRYITTKGVEVHSFSIKGRNSGSNLAKNSIFLNLILILVYLFI